MIQQVSNLIQLLTGQLKVDTGLQTKTLPDVNSLVLVKIIGKSGPLDTILLNGNTFKTKLPLPMPPGEAFIASVLKKNPLLLSANPVIAQNSMKTAIPLIMAMFGIKEGEAAALFIRQLVEAKKPLIKSRIERISNLLHAMQADQADDYMINLFVKVYLANDDIFDFLIEKQQHILLIPLKDIIEAIFQAVVNIFDNQFPPLIKKKIEEILICYYSPDGEYSTEQNVTDRDEKLLELVRFLRGFAAVENLTPGQRDTMNILLQQIITFLLQKSLYNRFGLYPDFLIYYNDTSLHLAYLNTYRSIDSAGKELLSLGTVFEQTAVGNVQCRGVIYRNKIIIEFFVEQRKIAEMKRGIKGLPDALEKSLHYDIELTVKESGERNAGGFTDRYSPVNNKA